MRVIATVWLILAASTAQAEWVQLASTADGGRHYVDPSTIKKTSNGYRVWDLSNYPTPQHEINGAMSIRGLAEYDCADEKIRDLQSDSFSQNWGGGKPLATWKKQGEWDYVAPKTVNEAKLHYVCSHARMPK